MHLPVRRVAAGIAAVALVLTACGSTGGSPAQRSASTAVSQTGVLPVIVSREQVVGRNRILFSFLDASGTKPLGAPDRTARVHFTGPGGQSVDAPDGTFMWAIEGVSGVYVTAADFPVPGAWMAQFTTTAPGSPEATIPFSFDVKSDAHVVVPGEQAPSVETPTLASVGGDISKVSTDPRPDKAFYEVSVAAQLAAHKPFVLVFATPKFCRTAICGPTLDNVKVVAAAHPEITFINVEPYQLEFVDGQLQPVLSTSGDLQTVPATDAYGLLSEPYTFVVGGDGIVKSSFELTFTPQEIEAALAGLS
jgi:hypothetical protein